MKTNVIYKTIYAIVFLFVSFSISAQEANGKTYKIIDNGSVLDVQPYIKALDAANMQYHRLKNANYVVIFTTGLKVELFSATVCKANGVNINPDNYPDSFDSSRQEPIFALGADNFILEQYITSGGKRQQQ